MDFLEKLNYLMNKNNLNKSTLSKSCDIPYTTIDGWYKKGYEGLKLTTLRKLAAYFGTSLDFWANDNISESSVNECAKEQTKTPNTLADDEAESNTFNEETGFEIINAMKKQKGWTNEDLARVSGVPKTTIDKITAGTTFNPSFDTVWAIAEAFGCSVDIFKDKKNALSSKDKSATQKMIIESNLEQRLLALPLDKVQSLKDYLDFLIAQANEEN